MTNDEKIAAYCAARPCWCCGAVVWCGHREAGVALGPPIDPGELRDMLREISLLEQSVQVALGVRRKPPGREIACAAPATARGPLAVIPLQRAR